MKKEKIFRTNITVGPYKEFLNEVLNLTESKSSSYVCFANVHMVIESQQDSYFNSVVNGADLVAPDGKPLSIYLRLFHGIKQERICGMDLFPDLLKEAEQRGKSVFFYGTTNEILERIKQQASEDYPLLSIAGCYSPPFRSLSSAEESAMVSMINNAKPDLLFVSLGCPKQEKWMAEHRWIIKSCMLGLGQAFHVYAGTEKRLPKWMRNLSLEWTYRLYLEPGRLWKRYLYGNSMFLFLAFRQLIHKIFYRARSLFSEKNSHESLEHQKHGHN